MIAPVVIVGAGGHAKVVVDALRKSGRTVVGLVDVDREKVASRVLGIEVIGDEDLLVARDPSDTFLANGMGPIAARRSVYERFKELTFRFADVVHPSAVVAESVALSEGVQIMAGAVVQPDTHLGENALVNSRASVDHDCDIGRHVHVAPGVTLAGGVRIGESSLVGAGATIIEGIELGSNCVVGAGAVVIGNVPDGATVIGVPAKLKNS